MSNKKEVLAATAAVAALAAAGSSASAADYQAPHDWSGFYVGLSAGSFMGTLPNIQDSNLGAYSLNSGSITPGVFGGFNVQSGNIVWGAEVAFQGNTSAKQYAANYNTYSLNSTIDAKARLGFATDNFMFYGFAGASTQDVAGHGDVSNYATYGLNFGVGIDYKATDHVVIGAEFTDRLMNGNDAYNDVAFHSSNQEFSLRASYLF